MRKRAFGNREFFFNKLHNIGPGLRLSRKTVKWYFLSLFRVGAPIRHRMLITYDESRSISCLKPQRSIANFQR